MDKKLNILLLGSGGREHALARKIKTSAMCNKLFALPGNPGIASLADLLEGRMDDFEHISQLITARQIDMLIVGPEQPLVDGLADYLREKNPQLYIIGPTKNGAQLEGSKAFAKKFMQRHQIPTAEYFEVSSTNIADGVAVLQRMTPPYVLKADGLAAGKGVLILDDKEEAISELRLMLEGKFGRASKTVVIEEFLSGVEFSVFALVSNGQYTLLPFAKDYKRVDEGDKGKNTGGMGSVSPVPFLDDTLMKKVKNKIIKPTIQGLVKEGIDYLGFIFFGLINVNGDPYVIEYNCRMGDPETQSVMVRIESDLVECLLAAAQHRLDEVKLKISEKIAVSVVMASGGYPNDFEKGFEISGDLTESEDLYLNHAGTAMQDGKLVTNGGRVLTVTALADEFQSASKSCLKKAELINFEKKYFRRDIGKDIFH